MSVVFKLAMAKINALGGGHITLRGDKDGGFEIKQLKVAPKQPGVGVARIDAFSTTGKCTNVYFYINDLMSFTVWEEVGTDEPEED